LDANEVKPHDDDDEVEAGINVGNLSATPAPAPLAARPPLAASAALAMVGRAGGSMGHFMSLNVARAISARKLPIPDGEVRPNCNNEGATPLLALAPLALA